MHSQLQLLQAPRILTSITSSCTAETLTLKRESEGEKEQKEEERTTHNLTPDLFKGGSCVSVTTNMKNK